MRDSPIMRHCDAKGCWAGDCFNHKTKSYIAKGYTCALKGISISTDGKCVHYKDISEDGQEETKDD